MEESHDLTPRFPAIDKYRMTPGTAYPNIKKLLSAILRPPSPPMARHSESFSLRGYWTSPIFAGVFMFAALMTIALITTLFVVALVANGADAALKQHPGFHVPKACGTQYNDALDQALSCDRTTDTLDSTDPYIRNVSRALSGVVILCGAFLISIWICMPIVFARSFIHWGWAENKTKNIGLAWAQFFYGIIVECWVLLLMCAFALGSDLVYPYGLIMRNLYIATWNFTNVNSGMAGWLAFLIAVVTFFFQFVRYPKVRLEDTSVAQIYNLIRGVNREVAMFCMSLPPLRGIYGPLGYISDGSGLDLSEKDIAVAAD